MWRSEGRGFHGTEEQVPRPWTENGFGLFKGKEEGQCIWNSMSIRENG